jgi:hypothetical protein
VVFIKLSVCCVARVRLSNSCHHVCFECVRPCGLHKNRTAMWFKQNRFCLATWFLHLSNFFFNCSIDIFYFYFIFIVVVVVTFREWKANRLTDCRFFAITLYGIDSNLFFFFFWFESLKNVLFWPSNPFNRPWQWMVYIWLKKIQL